MDSRVSELFGGCCRPGGGPAMGGTLKARGAGGSSGCGGPKGKKKNGKNRGSKANNPPYLPPRHLLQQAEDGNIEYKLKLVNPSQYRFEHLVTQMKWRLQEGRGEAVYQIGVEDNGLLVGLAEEEMRASLKTLHRMAEKVGADITVLREREVDYDSDVPRKITEVLVRKVPDNQQFLDLRVAVLGNVDSGKSTLLGVLTQGELDNGRGRARLNLFRHLHEIQSGRTSSISFEILGFNSKGEVVNYSDSRTAEEICESSSKMITFIDLAATTSTYTPPSLASPLTALTVPCSSLVLTLGLAAGTTREHLGLALALKVPFFVVVSKVDLCAKTTVERTVRQLERVLKQPGCHKVPMLVVSEDDAVTAAQQFAQSPNVTPIFTLSSVSGESLDLLKVFLNILPPLTNSKEQEELMQQLTEFQAIDRIFFGFRWMKSTQYQRWGQLLEGHFPVGFAVRATSWCVGPTDDGCFLELRVCSIQRNRSACRVLRAGQAATLALGDFDRALLRKGMVMVSPEMNPTICSVFEAEIVLLFHATTFRRGFQVTVHVGNVRQTAVVEKIHAKDKLRTGEKAVVRFRFLKHPEYLKVGAKLLFREGVTKGIGHVTDVQAIAAGEAQANVGF
ncbi:hypothetical protein QTO34_001482 [Cnephaeus nilssonii]|uniref:Tr-type G domain-containing protein n=1 Tax=Cnephaeus nilssonii TaxID=3371016 RepID=A0AA40HVS8_CNENI|nr:hypothetical protein QTO34_001482 [Eptesicus nilssonii]